MDKALKRPGDRMDYIKESERGNPVYQMQNEEGMKWKVELMNISKLIDFYRVENFKR